jgi:outer membrane protein OmpA-like peptidoglycan-associated protein
MGYKSLTLLFALIVGTIAPIFAQDSAESGEIFNFNQLPEQYWPNANRVKEKHQDQYDAYVNGDTLWAPREKRQLAVGLGFGPAAISGDVKSVGGYGASFFFRHNISYILSARYEFGFYRTYGQQYEPRTLRGDLMRPDAAYRNDAYNGTNNGVNYRDFGITISLDNYRTDILDLQGSLLLNLTNLLLMHKSQHRFNLYAHFGGGIMNYRTMVDVLDADGNPYNYNEIRKSIEAYSPDSDRGTNISPKERREVRDYLYNNVYEGRPRKRTYETPGEGHGNEEQILDRVSNFVFSGGFGFEYLVGKSKRVSVGLEHRVSLTNDDLLDGVRWADQGDLTRNFDTYHYVKGSVSVFLGGKEKRKLPMWWDNPVSIYARKYEAPGDRFKDSDNDGVDDFYDLEPDTPEDCPVDSKGRKLDSDGDGCPDCEDPEPFSSPLLPIVDCKNVFDGFATKECCDEKALLIGSLKDKCDDVVFPTVSFEYDRYGMSMNSYAALEQIAKLLQECPDIQVVVTGVTNTTKNVKYNEQLSWTRVNEAVDHLTEKYGISRDRFVVKYEGATIKSEGGEFDKFQNNRVEFRAAEAGEAGSSNPPAPHPGYKAGKP